jgi:preprotein translocase subunit SecD
MAVDANVLIFERIREELAAGKCCVAHWPPVTTGPGTIFDSHIRPSSPRRSHFMGTGPIKGSAMLTIGVA